MISPMPEQIHVYLDDAYIFSSFPIMHAKMKHGLSPSGEISKKKKKILFRDVLTLDTFSWMILYISVLQFVCIWWFCFFLFLDKIVELWTKRNFRCDCGNSKFGEFFCKLFPNKDIENVENSYNHNFKGSYCTCGRPYPDPDIEEQEEMIQCCICEDWFHEEHLGLESSDEVSFFDFSYLAVAWVLICHVFGILYCYSCHALA